MIRPYLFFEFGWLICRYHMMLNDLSGIQRLIAPFMTLVLISSVAALSPAIGYSLELDLFAPCMVFPCLVLAFSCILSPGLDASRFCCISWLTFRESCDVIF